jgi:hypothetical protein
MFKRLLAMAVMSLPFVAFSQTQADQDIALIKKNYYAVPYGMQLQILNAAIQSGNIDEAKLSAQLANAVYVTLSDCKAGPIAEILDIPLTDVLTPPTVGHDLLRIEGDKGSWEQSDAAQEAAQDSTMKVKEWLASLPGDA